MDVIFTYLNHAKKNCSTEVLNSLAKSAKLVWDWPNPMDAAKAASTLAEGMTRLDSEELLSEDDLMEEPNQTRVMDVLSRIKPERMNVGLVRPDASNEWKDDKFAKVQTLPHYGVKYNMTTLDNMAHLPENSWHDWGKVVDSDDEDMTQTYAKLAERLRAQNVSFDGDIAIALPGVIDDIPENMSLSHASATRGDGVVHQLWGVSPDSLQKNNSMELWFRKGWMTPQPWVEASLTLRAKKMEAGTSSSAKDIVTLQVGMHLLADELNQRLADVGYKGFYFSVSETHMGVYVWLSGFTPNLLNLTDRMLGEMDTAFDTPDNVSLARVVAGLKTDFTDNSGESVKTAFTDQKVLLTPRMHSKTELADAITNISEITYADAKKAVEDARHGPFYATSLVMGNYAEEDAKTLHQRLLDGLGAKTSVTQDEVEKVTPVVMPAVPVEIRKTNPREGDENHVTIVTVLVGTATVQNRVLLGLVGWIYSQVVFAELRTQMALGYVVGGGVSEMSTVLTIDCYVQGEKMLPDAVEGACEHVWAVTVPKEVKSLDDDTFASHKDSFKNSLLEGPLTTNQELTHFEDPILLGGCLELRSAMLAFLDTVNSKEQLLEAWSNAIMPMNGTKAALRKKVLVKYFNDGMAVPEPPNATEAEKLFKEAGLNGSILERMLEERKLVRYVDEANSTVRDGLAKEGGYFPAELQCNWTAPSKHAESDADAPFQVLKNQNRDSAHEHPSSAAAMAQISAGGVKGIMRSEWEVRAREAGLLRPVARHHSGEVAIEGAEVSTIVGQLQNSKSSRLVAPRPHLHPRPSTPMTSFAGFEGRSARGRRNLPGLPSRGGGRTRKPSWANRLMDFETSTPWP